MIGAYCPAAYEMRSGARWRCNLHAGHVGTHDDGVGNRWADAITTPGPGRLQVAAVNLLGSQEAWNVLRPALEKAVGGDLTEDAVRAVHGVLTEWAAR